MTTIPPIRAVLWDVDDTLSDYTGADRDAALRHLAEQGLLGHYPSAEHALRRWRAVMEEAYGRFLTGELSFADHRRARARAFLAPRATDAEADRWFDGYRRHAEAAWRLYPDVLPVLDALRTSHRHAVLSNSVVAQQDRKLRSLGIRDRFEALLCSGDIGHAKPAPEAFLTACAALRLEPSEVAYVGDRQDLDAEAARAAGLLGVWLDRGPAEPASSPDAPAAGDGGPAPGGPQPGTPRITTLAQLPGLLGS